MAVAQQKKKKKKVDEALEASRVSASLDEREKGFLGNLIENSSKWWSTDPEEQEKQLFPARPSDGGPLYKNRDQVWGMQPRTYRPGPGHPDYKGPIENKPQSRSPRSMEMQDAIIDSEFPRTNPKSNEQLQAEVEQDNFERKRQSKILATQVRRDQATDAMAPINEAEMGAEKQRIAMDEKQKQDSLIDVFATQAVPKLKDPNDKYNEDDYEADIALAASESSTPKKTKAKLREATGDFYIDPVSGFALDLRQLNKAIDRKQFMEEAALLPASTRAQFLASKGIIKKEDIPVDQEAELKKKYYQLQIANASLKLENEKKKMSPEQAKYFDIAKTAISSQNYYLASTMLEKAGVKDIDLEKIIANDGKYKASLLKKNGMSKNMENLTGFKPEQISSMRSSILKDWRTQDNPVSGEASKRSLLLKTYGLPDSEGEGAPDFTQMVDMGNGKKMSQFKASLLSRAADPTQAPVYAQQLAFSASKIPDDTSRWTPEDYEAWLTDSIVYLEMHQRVKNYDQYLRAEAGVVANEEGKTLSGKVESKAIGEEGTDYDKKNEEIIDTGPDPVPDMTNAEEAIKIAADNASGVSEQEGLLSKKLKETTVKEAEEVAKKQAKDTNVSQDKLLKKKYESGENKVLRAIKEEIKEANDPTYRASQIKGIGSSRAKLAGREPRWTDIKSYVKWLKDNNKFDDLGDDVKYYLSQIE